MVRVMQTEFSGKEEKDLSKEILEIATLQSRGDKFEFMGISKGDLVVTMQDIKTKSFNGDYKLGDFADKHSSSSGDAIFGFNKSHIEELACTTYEKVQEALRLANYVPQPVFTNTEEKQLRGVLGQNFESFKAKTKEGLSKKWVDATNKNKPIDLEDIVENVITQASKEFFSESNREAAQKYLEGNHTHGFISEAIKAHVRGITTSSFGIVDREDDSNRLFSDFTSKVSDLQESLGEKLNDRKDISQRLKDIIAEQIPNKELLAPSKNKMEL